MADDDFELWLGHIGRDRSAARRIHLATRRIGGSHGRSRGTFTGVRIGRGVGAGAMLSSPSYRSGATGRRAVVKASIVRLGAKGLSGAAAHLRYLQRDGTTREGERGQLYGPGEEPVDAKTFLERGSGDRHQFRFIVAPEDGAEYDDLKPLIRRWMNQVEQDLGTKLDWVAVDHFNTGHPHSHVVVRGKDELGRDLVVARNYMAHGLRERAIQLVDLDLGTRSPEELHRAAVREIEPERFTGIDRRLIRSVGEDGLVRPVHADPVEQSLRAGRLQALGRMGLAAEERRGNWRLSADLEPVLRRMGEKNDIIRTMQREMREHLPERGPGAYAIHDSGTGASFIGKVIARGLSDEHRNRHYLIVDATEGLSHYVDIGEGAPETSRGSIVRITPTPIEVRAVDRTVADIASANGGSYSVDLHLRHDPNASEAFAQTHVRRLEALRRASKVAERNADGSWTIARDHLARVEAHERQRAARAPVTIETLSERSLDRLAAHDGATWLDRTLVSDEQPTLGGGFGGEVRQALARRRQWLVEQQLAAQDGDTVRYRANLLTALQQRELRRVASQLSEELGLAFSASHAGQKVEGIYNRAITVGDAKFAVIEKSREFSLVPWRPVLERALGKQVSGIVRDGGISWTIGRGRSGPEIGSF
ncbi:relaxase/mobilization nuclease RlxS [Sphingomonas sp. ZT3P38]|uniref:relaxase/mobilization nuclease RlxS n=1 Tax=Parasphingomonas zepuensis TaxID=3096161 RepID=UPI002FCAC4A0